MQKYLLAILILTYSCAENENKVSSDSTKIMTENYASMVEANSMFCETLQLYEQKIIFTDSLTSSVKSYFDIKRLVETYLWIHNEKSCIEERKRDKLIECGVQINNKLVFVLDSIIKKNLEYDRKPWKEYVEKIEENVDALDQIYRSPDFSAKEATVRDVQIIQWLVRVEQVYNLVFQLAMRHKLEEEYRYEVRAPEIIKDVALEDGKRELTIYTYCAILADGQSLELYVDDEKIDPFNYGGDIAPGRFKIVYDQKNSGDTLHIKTVSETYINDEVTTTETIYVIPR